MDVLSNLGINPGYLLMQIALFVTFVLLLYQFLYKPILTTLDTRKERIAKGLEDARQAAIARDNADADAKEILDRARAEAARIRQQATEEAEETRRGIVNQAEAEANEIVAEAREDAQEERNRVMAELRNQVAAIAQAMAVKLVEGSLDTDQQRKMISDFLAKPPSGVRELSADTVIVTSALRLTEEEKSRIRALVDAETVEFRENPEILGGLIIRAGDLVIDDSVRYQMSEMQETLA